MFIEDWNSFYEQAEQLYRNDPLRTRYVTKYKHSSGKLILKVTDDRVCLQYKTDQQSDLKKVEKLNNLFFSLMAASTAAGSHADAAEPSGEEASAVDGDSDAVMEEAAPAATLPLKKSGGGSNHASSNHSRQSQSASQRGRGSRRQKG